MAESRFESIEHIKEVMNDLKGELGINKPSFQNRLREDDVGLQTLSFPTPNYIPIYR